jgi:hypothetical protein
MKINIVNKLYLFSSIIKYISVFVKYNVIYINNILYQIFIYLSKNQIRIQ